MPGMNAPSIGVPSFSTPWSARRTPTTASPAKSGSATGVPGMTMRPASITFWEAHVMKDPIDSTRPPRLSMNGGVNGSSRACHFPPRMKRPPNMKPKSQRRVRGVRFDAPRWSKR